MIVVSGLPRSGTSLMMQMLAAGGVPILTDGGRVADADNPHGYLEYAPVMRTRQDASWVAGAAGKAVKVVHLLLKDLPGETEYRVVLMRRAMEEVLASQRQMLKANGPGGGGCFGRAYGGVVPGPDGPDGAVGGAAGEFSDVGSGLPRVPGRSIRRGREG